MTTRAVQAGDVTVARKEVFGDWTSGVHGPTEEDAKVADVLNRRIGSPHPALTVADIDQIVEGIEEFIVGEDPDGDLLPIWQPYIDKLKALKR